MNSQHDCSPIGGQMMSAIGPPPPQNIMHYSPAGPLPPPNMRQAPCPSPMQQQHPSHHGHHMQAIPPQQQPSPHHPGFHQLPLHTPLSHSASPHPPSRPSTGPSPMHQQSPVHMNGPSPKVHPMQPVPQPHMNHHIQAGGSSHPLTSGPPPPHMMPLGVNQPPPPPPIPQTHNQNYIPAGGGPMSSPHPHVQYGQHTMNSHQSGPPPMPMHHHGAPLPPPPMQSAPHQGPPNPAYMSHIQPGLPERGSPFYQQIPPTEIRLIELNKRLQHRPRPRGPSSPLPLIESSEESSWWEKFVCDFFDDNSSLTLRVPGEDKPVEYTIGRTLIPRFFRSYFEGGVIDLTIKLRNTKEIPHHQISGFVTLECDQTDITTKNLFRQPATNMPMNVVVHTEGHLSLDFVSNNYNNDTLLIKSWRFFTHQCHEYIDRSMTTTGLPPTYLNEPVTRYGLTKTTVAYLKMCMIMEPMQDLMLQHRQTNMDPRTCLKHLLYDKYKLKITDDNRAQPNKRRKRKTTNATGATGTTKKGRAGANAVSNSNSIVNNNTGINLNIMSSNDVGMQNLPLASQDVLVVGEPSMLSADFGDENERRITRLENNQFDSSLLNGNNNKNHISQNQSQMNNDTSSNQIINQQQNNIAPPHQNNHDSGCGSGIQSMMNHTNDNHIDADRSLNNNMVMHDPNLGAQNSGGNNCHPSNNNNIVANSNNNNNGNSYQMNLMMNGNTNHVNHSHIAKSDIDLKQQQQQQQLIITAPVTESEAG